MRNETTSRSLYKGNTLPSPAQYEEGDLYLLVVTGELYVRNAGNWLLIGGSVFITDGANIGGGPGEVFDQKVGTILQFRTLESPDNTIQIVTTAGTVQVQLDPAIVATINSAVQGGVNRGTGLEVFAALVGNNLEFRTINSAGGGIDLLAGQDANHVYLASLTSSDGSVSIVKNNGTEVDLVVNPLNAGVVTDGANVGTGAGDIFRNKTGTVLNFRRVADGGGAIDVVTVGDDVVITGANGVNRGTTGARVFAGLAGNNLEFRRLVAGANVTITEGVDSITIDAATIPFNRVINYQTVYTQNFTGNTSTNVNINVANIPIGAFPVTLTAGQLMIIAPFLSFRFTPNNTTGMAISNFNARYYLRRDLATLKQDKFFEAVSRDGAVIPQYNVPIFGTVNNVVAEVTVSGGTVHVISSGAAGEDIIDSWIAGTSATGANTLGFLDVYFVTPNSIYNFDLTVLQAFVAVII